jgi:hypothetical protein
VGNVVKIIFLSIGVTAFVLLSIFGFAIWVFIPLLPAGIIFGIILFSERQRNRSRRTDERKADQRKAA